MRWAPATIQWSVRLLPRLRAKLWLSAAMAMACQIKANRDEPRKDKARASYSLATRTCASRSATRVAGLACGKGEWSPGIRSLLTRLSWKAGNGLLRALYLARCFVCGHWRPLQINKKRQHKIMSQQTQLVRAGKSFEARLLT